MLIKIDGSSAARSLWLYLLSGLARRTPSASAILTRSASDPARIFRAFRFNADGWEMTRETEAMIRELEWTEALTASEPKAVALRDP